MLAAMAKEQPKAGWRSHYQISLGQNRLHSTPSNLMPTRPAPAFQQPKPHKKPE